MRFLARIIATWCLPLILLAVFLFPNLDSYRTFHNKIADYGLTGLQVLRASTFSTPLGPPDRFGFHHPGPVFVYYLAAVGALIPILPAHGAHMLAQLVVNACLLAWIIHLFNRGTGEPSAGPIAGLALIIFVGSTGPASFINIWEANAVMLPFGLMLAGGAAAACGRESALLPLFIGATVAAQTQLGVAPVCFAVTASAVGTCLLSRRHAASLSGKGRAMVAFAILFLVAAWAPTFVEQIMRGPEGNLAKIAAHFRSAKAMSFSGSSLLFRFARISILPLDDVPAAEHIPRAYVCVRTILPLLCAGIGLVWGRGFLRALGALCLCSSIVSAISAPAAGAPLMPHVFYYYRVVVAMSYSAAAVTAVCRVARCHSLQHFRGPLTAILCGGVGAVALWYCAVMQATLRGSLDDHPYIDRLYEAIDPKRGMNYELVWGYGGKHHYQWMTASALAYLLKRDGFCCCVPDEWLFIFGQEMSCASIAGGITILSLFNADTPRTDVDVPPLQTEEDVTCGGTRMLKWTMPCLTLPGAIRYDAPAAYFHGFWPPGKGYRWSGYDHASIAFALGEEPRGIPLYTLVLVLVNFDAQELSLSLNGKALGSVAAERNLCRLTLNVPRGVLNFSGLNILRIDLPLSGSYAETGKEFPGIGFVHLSISQSAPGAVPVQPVSVTSSQANRPEAGFSAVRLRAR